MIISIQSTHGTGFTIQSEGAMSPDGADTLLRQASDLYRELVKTDIEHGLAFPEEFFADDEEDVEAEQPE